MVHRWPLWKAATRLEPDVISHNSVLSCNHERWPVAVHLDSWNKWDKFGGEKLTAPNVVVNINSPEFVLSARIWSSKMGWWFGFTGLSWTFLFGGEVMFNASGSGFKWWPIGLSHQDGRSLNDSSKSLFAEKPLQRHVSKDVKWCACVYVCVCVAKIYKVASGGVIFKCCLTFECPMKLIMSLWFNFWWIEIECIYQDQ